MHVNLMSVAFQRKQMLRNRARQWSVVLSAAGVIALVSTWNLSTQRREVKLELQALQVRYRPIEEMKLEIGELGSELAELEEREKITLSLAGEKPQLSLLGLVAKATYDGHQRTYVQNFEFRQQTARGREATHRFVLLLSGIGQDNLAVAQLAATLRDTGLFGRVEVTSTEAASIGVDTARSFQLECAF